jgi:hypothetical protein
VFSFVLTTQEEAMATARPTEKLRDASTNRVKDLPPATAALRTAIAAVNQAQKQLEAAQQPVDKLAYARAAATLREAAELRSGIARLRAAHEAEINRWVEAGGHGNRPEPSAELVPLERALGTIAAAAREAEVRFPASMTTSCAPPNASGTQPGRASRQYSPPPPKRPSPHLVNWSGRSGRRNWRKRGC